MSGTITHEEATRQVNQPTERTAVELENVQKAIQGILDEIDGRYDGAPDSTTLWMGEYINRLVNALTQLVVFEKSWELCKQVEKALSERVAELEKQLIEQREHYLDQLAEEQNVNPTDE